MSKVEILNGTYVSDQLLQNDLKLLQNAYEAFNKIRRPKLVVLTIGNNDASNIYVRNKKNLCEKCNITFVHLQYNESVSFEEIKEVISKLNNDSSVDGILIQQPFPVTLKGIDQLIKSSKDVDGFTKLNIANTLLSDNINNLYACTPYGILRLLNFYNIDLTGKNVLILGRSNIVGKPLIGLLLQKNATVISCNSYTQDISALLKNADVIISAIGKTKFLKSDMLSDKTEVIIDVGINRDETNKICGDVDFDDIKNYWENITDNKVRYITPVPKGIGPMTVESLVHNIIIAYKNNLGDTING